MNKYLLTIPAVVSAFGTGYYIKPTGTTINSANNIDKVWNGPKSMTAGTLAFRRLCSATAGASHRSHLGEGETRMYHVDSSSNTVYVNVPIYDNAGKSVLYCWKFHGFISS